MNEFLPGLTGCAVVTERLNCADYSFEVDMNPWQHPIFDKNMHHLLAAVAALCNGCGGIIYLVGEDVERLPKDTFKRFEQRSTALITRTFEISSLVGNFVQVSLSSGEKKIWAAVLLKKSRSKLQYPTAGEWQHTLCKTDLWGSVSVETTQPAHRQHREELATARLPLPEQTEEDHSSLHTMGARAKGDSPTDKISSASPQYGSVSQPTDIYVESPNLEVDFSTYQRLAWSENKKDWQKYVKIKELTTDDMIRSCDMWKPAQPMRFTPDTASLRHFFQSEHDRDKTLSAVSTGEPGFAIVCSTWKFHLFDNDTILLPEGHVCDIVTVSAVGRVSLWVIADGSDDRNVPSQMKYMMTTGRMLKYHLMQKGVGDNLSNLWVDCRLFSPKEANILGSKTRLRIQESESIRNHLIQFYDAPVNFESLQYALAKVILSRQSPLTRCVGDNTSITLSGQQAKVLMHKAKVNYISGPAGSGKSWTAGYLYKMYGKDKSVYMCTTWAFREYLKSNGCIGTLILGDKDLIREIKNGTFEKKTCVIIDDSHAFTCTKTSLKPLFQILKDNREMSLFVFADNEYQSFDRKRQRAVYSCIHELTQQMLRQSIVVWPLTEIYRNTRKVVSFVQSAIQDVYEGHQKIESANPEDGEGVECIKMADLWEDHGDNDLVVYLRSLQSADIYKPEEVAILLDHSYTTEQIRLLTGILETQMPDISVHRADVFPRTGVVVDSVDSFLGLDATVCVFILSNTHKRAGYHSRFEKLLGKANNGRNIYNPRYEVFLASRATHKAVFVVPEMHSDLVQQMKFDYFQVHVFTF